MKILITKTLFFLLAIVVLFSCSKSDDTPTDHPVGGDAFKMQVMSINLPNTTLSATDYHGSMGNVAVNLTKGDEHKLLFMIPSDIAVGNQDLVISDLNNLKITYNVKDVVLPDTADATINQFQNNLDTFQAGTMGNVTTQNAITSYNQVYANATTEDKIKMATLYYANKTLFDDIILNDYSSITGRNINGIMASINKHKVAVLGMAVGVLMLYFGEPLVKVAGAILALVSAHKAFGFGSQFINQSVNSLNLQMDGVDGTNDKSVLSGLQLTNDVPQTVSFNTLDRTVISSDSSKDNVGTKLFFTYYNMYNGFVQQANPVLTWLNSNVPFCNFNLMTPETVATISPITSNPIDVTTFSHFTFTITDPNLSLVSTTLSATGQLSIRVKAVGSSVLFPINSSINYSYEDEFSSFSGILPIIVSNDNIQTVTIGSQIWTLKNLDVTSYRNGDPIPQVTDPTVWSNLTTGAWCYYENNTANGPVYGKLYNWYAVNDPRGLAPAGYHVPSDVEWSTLINFLDPSANGGNNFNVAGGKMKATTGWLSPNTAATNSSGFTGLPGGIRRGDNGAFGGNIGYGAVWWSSSEDGTTVAWVRDVDTGTGDSSRLELSKAYGLSVRCLKD